MFYASLLFQLTNPYISLKKKIMKFTTTGIYAGFSTLSPDFLSNFLNQL